MSHCHLRARINLEIEASKLKSMGFIDTDIKDLLPLKKLDESLKYLLNNEGYKNFKEINEGAYLNTTDVDIEEIVEKLEKDGFVVKSKDFQAYRATFEGRFFMTNTEGYLKKIQAEYQVRKKKISDDNYQLRYQWRSLVAVSFAGFGATALVVWEIIQYCLK